MLWGGTNRGTTPLHGLAWTARRTRAWYTGTTPSAHMPAACGTTKTTQRKQPSHHPWRHTRTQHTWYAGHTHAPRSRPGGLHWHQIRPWWRLVCVCVCVCAVVVVGAVHGVCMRVCEGGWGSVAPQHVHMRGAILRRRVCGDTHTHSPALGVAACAAGSQRRTYGATGRDRALASVHSDKHVHRWNQPH